MISDTNKGHTGVVVPSLSEFTREQSGYRIKGEVFWELIDHATGDSSKGHLNNIVTLDAGILIARLLKGPDSPASHVSEPSYGIWMLAVGTGDPGWDPQNPVPANVYQRYLYSELARKKWSSTSFINSNGTVSLIPTNVVDFTFSFGVGEAVGPLVEMGLLGGDVNSDTSIRNPPQSSYPNGPYNPMVSLKDRDTLCNYLTFPVINKSSTSTLSWTWRLTF